MLHVTYLYHGWLSRRPGNHVCNSLHTATQCAFLFLCKQMWYPRARHTLHLEIIIQKSICIPIEMFKCCASSQTTICWSSHTIMAVVFHKTLLQTVLGRSSRSPPTTFSRPFRNALYQCIVMLKERIFWGTDHVGTDFLKSGSLIEDPEFRLNFSFFFPTYRAP